MKEVNNLIKDLSQIASSKNKRRQNFPNYIHRIRFPVYKNLERDCQIGFEFPVTVFVGQNGCGKSSVLHALQGAPANRSVGNYWFSTKLDPIQEGRGKPNCFIYEYYNPEAAKYVEVIKQRVKYEKARKGERKRINPDYWEPSRASIEYGMEAPGKKNGQPEPGSHATRWKVPKINVEYLDFRSELSAFDQYFYFGDKPKDLVRYNSKQDRLRSWVKNRLSPILSGQIKHISRKNKKKLNIRPVLELGENEVSLISEILGKNYSGCRMVEHSIFGTQGYSVQFFSESRAYTEAFAGSGEMAVVRVVNTVVNAEPNSLILLDEPEVSLHPGAQKKLRDFLLQESLDRRHQVIICTHSPVFLEGLPKEAIRVFVPSSCGKFRVAENVCRNDAFVQIGQTVFNKKRIVVEDAAAKALVQHAVKVLGPEYEKVIEVEFYPGGESSIFKDLVVHARQEDENIYVIFDGDIFQGDWPDEATLAPADLDEEIAKYCQQSVNKLNFRSDGGGDKNAQKNMEEIKRSFLRFLSKRCFFLPVNIPEELIWGASTIEGKQAFEHGEAGNYKEYIGSYVLDQFGEDSANARTLSIKQILNKSFDNDDKRFQQLLSIIKEINAE